MSNKVYNKETEKNLSKPLNDIIKGDKKVKEPREEKKETKDKREKPVFMKVRLSNVVLKDVLKAAGLGKDASGMTIEAKISVSK